MKTVNQKQSHKDFNLMVIGQVISILGSALLRFALSLYILDLTGRSDLFATMFAISNIPLLLSPIGGAIADRFNRRNEMVIFDFTSGAIIFGYCFCLSQGNGTVLLTGIVMVLLAIISTLYQPAVTASIPLLVEENKLESANGLVNAVQALSNVAAPIIGGVLYGIFGVQTLVFISAIAFVCSAILELFIHIPFVKRIQEGNIIPTLAKDMKESFHYVKQNTLIFKSMILASALNLILTPFFVVGGPIILKIAMQSNDAMYGVGMGIINFATILGALLIGSFAKKMKMKTIYKWLLYIAVFMLPIAFSITPMFLNLGYYPSFILFVVCAVPVAMIMTVISIFVITKVQKVTPNENLGKVMAIITAVSQCAAPVGQLLYGMIFQVFQANLFVPALFISVSLSLIAILTKKKFAHEAIA